MYSLFKLLLTARLLLELSNTCYCRVEPELPCNSLRWPHGRGESRMERHVIHNSQWRHRWHAGLSPFASTLVLTPASFAPYCFLPLMSSRRLPWCSLFLLYAVLTVALNKPLLLSHVAANVCAMSIRFFFNVSMVYYWYGGENSISSLTAPRLLVETYTLRKKVFHRRGLVQLNYRYHKISTEKGNGRPFSCIIIRFSCYEWLINLKTIHSLIDVALCDSHHNHSVTLIIFRRRKRRK